MKIAPLPSLGQGGAGSSQRLLPGSFEAVKDSKAEGNILNHPCRALGPACPSSVEEVSLFSVRAPFSTLL